MVVEAPQGRDLQRVDVFCQMPERSLRKSGMPEGVLMPAPVRATVREDAASNSTARSTADGEEGVRVDLLTNTTSPLREHLAGLRA